MMLTGGRNSMRLVSWAAVDGRWSMVDGRWSMVDGYLLVSVA
ncbi:MAG: hypothetical protein ACYDEB_13580 [Dehalococcoidia bacterium]